MEGKEWSREKAEEAVGLAIKDVLAVAGELGLATLSERIKTSNLNYDLIRAELRFLSADVMKLKTEFRKFQADMRTWAKTVQSDIQALHAKQSLSAGPTGPRSAPGPAGEESWD